MTLLHEPTAGKRRSEPRRRSWLRTLSSVLIVAGALLLADAGLTVAWQEPLSALYNRFEQDKLAGQLERLGRLDPTPLERRALESLPDESARLAFQARALDRRARSGQPIGRIRMPRLGLSVVIVEGIEPATLRSGPGHYPGTPLPGAPGTVALAGHRTTYGAPFRRIDRLRPRDEIEVQMPYGRFVYSVEKTEIVPPTATYVTRRVGHDRLVLTACHPLYSAAERIVVFARLVREEPTGSLI